MKKNIYQRATENGCTYETNCTGISLNKWESLMKGARKADQKKAVKVALQAGVIDEYEAKLELKNPYYNPYNHKVTKTHIIYIHSAIEHFIRVY
jgi:hypothetical protein